MLPPRAVSDGDLSGRTVVGLAELDGDSSREILVQDAPDDTLEIWKVESGAVVRVAQILAPPGWRLVAAEDLDADGISDLWWQTDVPGRVEVWKLRDERPVDLLARVDTGARGALTLVADFDGDGTPEALWRDPETGALTITYLRPGGGGDPGALEQRVELPTSPGDPLLEVRGAAEIDSVPGADILLQNRNTLRVLATLPLQSIATRIPLFDVDDAYALVHVQ